VFYESSGAEGAALYCVSPRNEILLREVTQDDGSVRLVQDDPTQRCPTNGQASRRRGFRAWNISLSIAQAF
jgi:hypothetical protein